MKSLLIIFSLVGGFFATDDTALEFVTNNVRGNAMHEQFDGNKEGFILTAEEEALRIYANELKEGYDFENLTEEEKITALDEIRELVIIKAEELGVDITPMLERFEERFANYELHNSPEWIEFREYMDQLFLDYNLANLAVDEKIAAMDEIHELMVVKAEELGVDITEILEKQLKRAAQFELMNSEELVELRAYHQELMSGYDFENMTEEEILAAMDEIKVLIQAKADELGIDLSLLQQRGQHRPNGRPGNGQGGNHQGRSKDFKTGFRAGRNYQRGYDAGRRSNDRPNAETTNTGSEEA